ncbi:ATP-binding protein [Streptomyces sp. NPDC055186]
MEESSLRAVGWARSLPINTSPKAARDWARRHMRSLAWTDRAPETVDAVLLTVSELVTNAHVHAHSPAQMAITWDGECLHVAVHDSSTALPTQRAASSDRIGGRGMLLVDALTDGWEAHSCPHGKTVIACFRPPAETQEGTVTLADGAG